MEVGTKLKKRWCEEGEEEEEIWDAEVADGNDVPWRELGVVGGGDNCINNSDDDKEEEVDKQGDATTGLKPYIPRTLGR